VDVDADEAGAQSSYILLSVDLNDAPVITSNGGDDTVSVAIAENTTLIATLATIDADLGQTPTFALLGEDADLFEIRNGTELHFKNAPDFENPPATGTTPDYQLIVQVTDGFGGIDTQSFTVTLVNVNDTPITFDAIGGADSTISAAEVGTPISGTVEAGVNDVTLNIGGLNRTASISGTTWSYTLNSDDLLALGQGTDKTITATATDTGGNATLATSAPFAIDTLEPPAPSIISISEDTGTFANDGITNDQTLVLSGTAEANSTVQIFRDGTAIATATTNGSGNWNFNYTSTSLANGSYSFTAIAMDAAGNTSTMSSPLNVTVDTTIATPTLALAIDSGKSNSDRITNSGVVNVSGLEAGASWQYSINNGATWIDGTGTSFTLTEDGAKSAVVRQTDLAGNTSSVSPTFTFTLDTSAPVKMVVIANMTKDTGTSATDFITNDGGAGRIYRGTISAALVAANESLQISVDGGITWSNATVRNKSWTFTDTTAKSSNWTIQARVIDTAGNSGPVAVRNVILDQSVPAASSIILDLLATSDAGVSSTDNLTNVQKPKFAVAFDSTTARAGDVVQILGDSSIVLGSATLTAAQAIAGSVEVTLSVGLVSGINTLSAVYRDRAGNSVTGNNALAVTYENQISAATAVTLDLLAASDSGQSSMDNITNLPQPTFEVTFDSAQAQVGDILEIRKGSTVLGSVTLDAVQVNAGSVNIALSTALSSGSNTLSVVHRDPAGNSVTGAFALAVTLDTLATAPILSGYTSTTVNGTAEANATLQFSTNSSAPVNFAGTPVNANGSGNYTIDTSGLDGSTAGTTYYLYAEDLAGNLSLASSQRVVVGTSGIDTLTGVGGNGSDLLVGGNGIGDTARYTVTNQAIALTGQISSASGTINVRTANIDVLTGIEQIDFTGTGYRATGANQLKNAVQTSLVNNSVATFIGVYNDLSGTFSFGAANPNATLVTFDSNPGNGKNYEAFLLLGETNTISNIGLNAGTVSLTF
jgi:hypothetical protein